MWTQEVRPVLIAAEMVTTGSPGQAGRRQGRASGPSSPARGIDVDRDRVRLNLPSGPLFPNHREVDDGLYRFFHVLAAHPFEPGMKCVLAGEYVGAGQTHER